MSNGTTLLQIAIAVAVLVWVIAKRFSPRPVRGDSRRWRLPLVLCAIGGYEVASLGRHTPPIHLTGTDLSFLVLCGLISAALGLLRGGTIRIYPLNGELMQRYAPVTAALWIGTIAIRLAMDLAAPSFGVNKSVASTSLLLMFGISLLGESLAVAARTAGSLTEAVR
jgi:hypothetical protein